MFRKLARDGAGAGSWRSKLRSVIACHLLGGRHRTGDRKCASRLSLIALAANGDLETPPGGVGVLHNNLDHLLDVRHIIGHRHFKGPRWVVDGIPRMARATVLAAMIGGRASISQARYFTFGEEAFTEK